MRLLVVFDIDGTLTPIKSSWNFIHTVLSTKLRSEHYKSLFFNKELSYDEWVYLDLSLWKGLSYETFKKILYAIPWRRGIERLTKLVNNYRDVAKFIAITGGFSVLCERVMKELGFEWCIGTEIELDENNKLTGCARRYVGFRGKASTLQEYIEESHEKYLAIVSVGDDVNDVELFQQSDVSIAFCCEDNVGRYASIHVRSCNISKLVEVLESILKRLIMMRLTAL